MYTVRKVTDDLYYVGGDDRRLALFENIFPIPQGVSYNSYLLMDEKTVLVDSIDWAVTREYMVNIARVLDGRDLDYMIIHHMEPDHCSAIELMLQRYPNMKIISSEKGVMSEYSSASGVPAFAGAEECRRGEVHASRP